MRTVASLALTIAIGLPTIVSAADQLRIQDTTIAFGATNATVPVVGTHDQDIQGLSLSILYDSVALDCTGVAIIGSAIEAASPGGIPEFMSFIIDDAAAAFTGQITGGVIFDLDPITVASIPASPTIEQTFAYLAFTVAPDTLPGVFDIELVNGQGSPPIDNAYSSEGFTTLPTLVSGAVTIDNPFNIRMPNLTLPPGATVPVVITCDHPLALNGFVLSMTYDNSQLFVEDFGGCPPGIPCPWHDGLDVDIALSPDVIEFFNPVVVRDITPGTDWIGLAANFDAVPPFAGQEIPAGTNHSLAELSVTVAGGLLEGDSVSLNFTDNVGSPTPLSNILIVQAGESLTPNFDHLNIVVGPSGGFRRADANGDGNTDVADAIFLVSYFFVLGVEPACFDAADSNDTGVLDLSDVIYIIQWQFAGGPPPPAPGPDNCGPDPTVDALECMVYTTCP